MHRVLVIFVATVFAATTAAQQTLYHQAPHTPGAPGGNGLSVFRGTLTGTFYDRQVADDFVVPGPAFWVVQGVRTHGVWFSSAIQSRSFRVSFYSDSANRPANDPSFDVSVPNTQPQAPGRMYFGRREHIYTMGVGQIILKPGAWWIVIQPAPAGENFFQLTSTPTTPLQRFEVYIRDPTGNSRDVGYPIQWAPGHTAYGGASHDVAFALIGFKGTWIVTRPAYFSFFRGVLVSGNLESLHNSDDERMVARPGVIVNQTERPVRLIVEGAAPRERADAIKIRVEAHCSIPNINQVVEAYRFATESYVVVDSRSMPTADLGQEWVLPGNPNDYIGVANSLRARISYKEAGPVFNYPWFVRIDEATWRVLLQ